MKDEYLVAGVVYLVSFFNMMVAFWLYRRASKTNNTIKHELHRAEDIHTDMNKLHKTIESYKNAVHPANIVRGMDYDDFVNWLEIGTIDDIKAARQAFAELGMEQDVRIIDGYLANKKQ